MQTCTDDSIRIVSRLKMTKSKFLENEWREYGMRQGGVISYNDV